MKVIVFAHRRPNFRSAKWKPVLDNFVNELHALFDEKKEIPDKWMELYFPERYLNALERQFLFERLKTLAPAMEWVQVHTHCKEIVVAAQKLNAEIMVMEENFPAEALANADIDSLIAEPYSDKPLTDSKS